MSASTRPLQLVISGDGDVQQPYAMQALVVRSHQQISRRIGIEAMRDQVRSRMEDGTGRLIRRNGEQPLDDRGIETTRDCRRDRRDVRFRRRLVRHRPPDDHACFTQLQQAAPYAIHQAIGGNSFRAAFESLLHEWFTGKALGNRSRDQRIDRRQCGWGNAAPPPWPWMRRAG